MVSKSYVGDIGTIIQVDCCEDISAASASKFIVKKPDGSETDWVAEIYNLRYLRYVIKENDFNIAGKYKLQPKLTIGAWTGLGTTVTFVVYDKYTW